MFSKIVLALTLAATASATISTEDVNSQKYMWAEYKSVSGRNRHVKI